MLHQKLEQKLLPKLSPQQIQLIKLLEVPIMELEQRIKKELEENPVLEEGQSEEMEDQNNDVTDEQEYENEYDDEFSVEDYLGDDDIPGYKLSSNNHSGSNDNIEIPYSEGISFREHMLSQLNVLYLTETEKYIAQNIIGNIDGVGYLRRELSSIVNDLAFSQNITVSLDDVTNILEIIQEFEPAGIGARDLQECLILQLNIKIKNRTTDTKSLKLSKQILTDYFNEFSKKHYQKILKKLNIDKDSLKAVVADVLKLNPKPGNAYSHRFKKNSQQITPDFILQEIDGDMVLQLNSPNVPSLHINKTYENMLKTFSDKNKNKKKKRKTKSEKDTIIFVKQKLDSAKWFIDAIKQRQNTLLLTMHAILDYQKKYFKTGNELKLRPMILKNIAEKTNLDISTISRVANSKYIQTQYGIFSLKYFFSESMETQEGEEVSTREIKKILSEAIDMEYKKKPLTDEKLAKILQDKGYKIARRTVAKYREQMNILVARLRKEI